MLREMANPIPVPSDFVEKNGSKSCSTIPLGKPGPESRTLTRMSISVPARADDNASRIWAHSRHCFKGVDGEVEKDLQELHRISPNLARIGINFVSHFYLPFNGISVHNADELANDGPDLDQSAACRVF